MILSFLDIIDYLPPWLTTTLLDYSISKMKTQKMNSKIPRVLLGTTLTRMPSHTKTEMTLASILTTICTNTTLSLSSFALTLLDIIHCSTPLRPSMTSWNSSPTNTSFACSDFLATVLV
eukprot:scaffold115418_cov66-Attheya_sp.AAC.2